MRVCPKCGYSDDPRWKPLFWKIYWEYAPLEDFKELIPNKIQRRKCDVGNFWYDFEDEYYYYKLSGKTRQMLHRFPKGFESMANRKLFEKTPSEKYCLDAEQKKLFEVEQ